MLYELAHIIKNKLSILWDIIEWSNSTIFYIIHKKQLVGLDSILHNISTDYIFRLANVNDVCNLVTFFSEQPIKSFEFFNPHDFNDKAIRKVINNKSFLTFVVEKNGTIVGYFFLRCFINGKCFRGKIVHKDWQGMGIAKKMGIAMTNISVHLGLRMFGSISPENYASMASAKASNNLKIHKILKNGYYYIEFLPKV